MLIIPAIDIIEGRCVRLNRGKFGTQKSYNNNPREVANRWRKEGAQWLHIVDLDGAKAGTVKNLDIAVDIKQNIDIKVQYGGGIRNIEILKMVLDGGIDRAILGTKAIEDKNFLEKSIEIFGNRIILSADFGKGGLIFKNGWQKSTEVNIFDFTRELEKLGIKEIIVTDISRDGTLAGTNVKFIGEILENTNLDLIIAGGISSLDDILGIKKLENLGVSGVIIGKALYEGKINLRKAIEIGLS